MKIIISYKFFRLFAEITFLILFLSSCSAINSNLNANSNLFSADKAFAKDSSYYIHVPSGWFSSIDNTKSSSDIFLANKNFSEAINLVPIHTESNYKFDKKTNKLLNFSKIMKEAELKSKLITIGETETFVIKNIKCMAYKYYNNSSLPVRTILFSFNNHFYELNAYITESGLNGQLIPEDLYTLQNSILFTIMKSN